MDASSEPWLQCQSTQLTYAPCSIVPTTSAMRWSSLGGISDAEVERPPMTWPDRMVAGVGIVYLGTAILYGRQRQWPFALMFAGYALAQVGILWKALGR